MNKRRTWFSSAIITCLTLGWTCQPPTASFREAAAGSLRKIRCAHGSV